MKNQLALKRAIFPDSKSLQPMPTPDVHANISGNINSTTEIAPSKISTLNIPSTQNNPNNVQPQTTGTNKFPFYSIWGIVIFLIIFLIIFAYKKFKRE
jgi:hypothetical protein